MANSYTRRARKHMNTDTLMHEPLVLILVEIPVAFMLHTNRRNCHYLNIKTAVLLVWGFEQCNPWIYDCNNDMQTRNDVCVWLCVRMQAYKVAPNSLNATIVYILWFNTFFITSYIISIKEWMSECLGIWFATLLL